MSKGCGNLTQPRLSRKASTAFSIAGFVRNVSEPWHSRGRMIGRVDRFRHDVDVIGEIIRALGRLLHILGDRLGRCGLLLDGAGDRSGNQIDIVHHIADGADRADGVVGQILN